jgi:hypothetical protein
VIPNAYTIPRTHTAAANRRHHYYLITNIIIALLACKSIGFQTPVRRTGVSFYFLKGAFASVCVDSSVDLIDLTPLGLPRANLLLSSGALSSLESAVD